MNEPATAITDLLLAIECGVLALVAGATATEKHPLRGSTVLLFWSLAVAALLGFITHAFIPNHSTRIFAVLWRTLLLSIAVAGAATCAAAGMMWASLRVQRASVQVSGIALLALGTVIVVNAGGWAEGYEIALISYGPAMLWMLFSFSAAFWTGRPGRPVAGAIGVLLSFAAAVAQQSSWRVGPLDHNALYHMIQAVALILIFVALRAAMATAASQTARSAVHTRTI